ncbi:retrovirus-related pol polyprotein from transposon TNT 1-94, partial [Tanacetum coccineum]
SKTTKEKVKSLALKAKVTRDKTSDDSDSQGGCDEDVDEEEEAEAFNLLVMNFHKFFRKGNRFRRGNRIGKSRNNSFGNKGGESSKPKGECYNCGIEGHFASKCRKLKENRAFIRGAWSDSEDGDEHQNDATCLMTIDSQRYVLNEYDGGHVIFGSNLKVKVVGGGNITHDSITITNVEHVSGLAFNLISVGQLCDNDCIVSFTKVDCTISKNGKMLAKGHRRNDLYICKLGDNSKQQICLASVVDNSTLWHRRLGHTNLRESSSLKSVLDDKALEDSSSDSDFDGDLHLNDEEDNVNEVVIP